MSSARVKSGSSESEPERNMASATFRKGGGRSSRCAPGQLVRKLVSKKVSKLVSK